MMMMVCSSLPMTSLVFSPPRHLDVVVGADCDRDLPTPTSCGSRPLSGLYNARGGESSVSQWDILLSCLPVWDHTHEFQNWEQVSMKRIFVYETMKKVPVCYKHSHTEFRPAADRDRCIAVLQQEDSINRPKQASCLFSVNRPVNKDHSALCESNWH